MKFKYSEGDVVGNLEIKGLGGTSKSCGCVKSKRGRRVAGSGRRSTEGTRVEINNLISIYKSNARKRGVSFDLTYAQFETLVDGECYFCGDIGGNTLRKRGYNDYSYNGIDRVDNSVGYLPSNCISCCSWCNRAKNNGTLANFVDKCKKIASRIEMEEKYFDIGAERMRNHIKNE